MGFAKWHLQRALPGFRRGSFKHKGISGLKAILATCAAALLVAASGAHAQSPGKLPDRIKIGVLLSVSGGASGAIQQTIGEMVKMVKKEFETNGTTLAGRPVDFVFADDASDTTQAITEAKRLIERVAREVKPMAKAAA